MRHIRFHDEEFRTSTFSGGDAGTCVEVAIRDDVIGVRDSKDPLGPVLIFSVAEWQAFINGARVGEFDHV